MTRRLVYVLNPAAGHGKRFAGARADAVSAKPDAIHLTEHVGECTDFVAECCLRDPDTHFVICGGDGTLGEAATGIMRAGAGERARLTPVPCGSGNDFVRGLALFPVPAGEDSLPIDLIHANGRYSINMLNMGFDCDVVLRSEALRRKPLLATGGLSYTLGIALTLGVKKALHAKIELGGIGGDPAASESVEGDFLLTAIGNLPFYGGGYRAAPAADPSDGLLDVLLVRDMSRARFLTLVGDYKKGTHVNAETGSVMPRFRDILVYRKCRSLRLSGAEHICLDGEVIPASGVHAEIIPHAIWVIPKLP